MAAGKKLATAIVANELTWVIYPQKVRSARMVK